MKEYKKLDIKHIEKYFKKKEKHMWAFWYDYELISHLNGNYGYYLTATLHRPIDIILGSPKLEDNLYKIILHRYFDRESLEDNLELGDSIIVYKGLIENESDLNFLLSKLGILQT